MKGAARIQTLCVAILLAAEAALWADDAPAVAPNPPEPVVVVAPVTDPARVAQHYREVLARAEFQDTEEPDISSRFKDYLTQWFLRLGTKIGEFKYASRIPAFESLLMTFLVGFAIAGLLYSMLRLTRRRIGIDDDHAPELAGRHSPQRPELFAEAIREAVRVRDWRTAWLTAWRQFLARLENGRLIEPDRTHTNREYLAALRAQPLPPSALALLDALVESYDRVIYGRQLIAEQDWTAFHGQIDEAVLLLHLEEKSRASIPGTAAPAAP